MLSYLEQCEYYNNNEYQTPGEPGACAKRRELLEWAQPWSSALRKIIEDMLPAHSCNLHILDQNQIFTHMIIATFTYSFSDATSGYTWEH